MNNHNHTRINFIAYYYSFDGYGRFNSFLTKAMIEHGIDVKVATMDYYYMPKWMLDRQDFSWNDLTISSMPPYLVKPIPGRHWLLTMIEGSVAPQEWVDKINQSGVERVLVPCEHNKRVFEEGGVKIPIDILPGGTDPSSFPLVNVTHERPFTFLTLADRGFRKGWEEVYLAFFKAFGGKTDGNRDVRLLIKSRPNKMIPLLRLMEQATEADPRVVYDYTDAPNIYDTFRQADCVALPSRCEGWGMPHREAACMGLTTITQDYSGLDDGYTSFWSIPVSGTMRDIPKEHLPSLGQWRIANQDHLVTAMRSVYNNQDAYKGSNPMAANWIRDNQTWQHSARRMKQILIDNV